MTYFHPAEFRCKCGCGGCKVDPRLTELLDKVRGEYGQPMFVLSGYRCENHNLAVGGKPNSAHLTGHAADILCENSKDRYRLLLTAFKHFNRIGVHKTFLHVDTHPTNPQETCWLY